MEEEIIDKCWPFPPLWGLLHLSPQSQALHEGGVDGVVEGLALSERRLPPLECLGRGVKWIGKVGKKCDVRVWKRSEGE